MEREVSHSNPVSGHVGCQEVGSCHTTGESKEMCRMNASVKCEFGCPLRRGDVRGDVSSSPKQGYQWPHKRTCVLQIFFLKKEKKCTLTICGKDHGLMALNHENGFVP